MAAYANVSSTFGSSGTARAPRRSSDSTLRHEGYAKLCGGTLARAHARSGDPIEIASYLGGGNGFDRAIADFSEAYADQNEQDFEAFSAAADSGRIEARADL